MAVARVQYGQAASGTSVLNVPLASAPIAGHKLVAVQSTSGYNNAFTTPPGWTILAGPTRQVNNNTIAFWKDADGTEGTAIAFSGHDNDGAVVYEVSGAVAGAPTAAFTFDATSTVNVVFAAESPAQVGSLALEFVAPTNGGDSATVPAGYTAEAYTNVPYHGIQSFYRANPATGTNCAQPSTLSPTDDWDALIVLIAPPVVAATGTAVGNAAYTSGAIGTGRSATCIGNG